MATSVFRTIAQDQSLVESRALVSLPFRADLIGTATVNGASGQNNDGTKSGIFSSRSASASWANSLTIEPIMFNGPVFGLRFPRSNPFPVGVVIDGVPYDVPYGQTRNPVTFATASSGLADEVIIADDLGDGPHYAQLHFPCSTAATRTMQLHGIVVDSRTNPAPPPRGESLTASPVALTTSFQSVSVASLASYGISGIHFVNTTGSAVTVNVRYTSGTGTFWSRSVPANDTLDYAPPGGRPLYHPIEISASATGVNAYIAGIN